MFQALQKSYKKATPKIIPVSAIQRQQQTQGPADDHTVDNVITGNYIGFYYIFLTARISLPLVLCLSSWKKSLSCSPLCLQRQVPHTAGTQRWIGGSGDEWMDGWNHGRKGAGSWEHDFLFHLLHPNSTQYSDSKEKLYFYLNYTIFSDYKINTSLLQTTILFLTKDTKLSDILHVAKSKLFFRSRKTWDFPNASSQDLHSVEQWNFQTQLWALPRSRSNSSKQSGERFAKHEEREEELTEPGLFSALARRHRLTEGFRYWQGCTCQMGAHFSVS